MEKLTFYAVSAPEKLDRIGAYLAERLSRDVLRHRYGYVVIAMEALDQLLMACHSQSIKPFVESFLHMVAKLLESQEPDLQVLGTNSFVKFANIEEDTPSYHRRYDFFVSQFSAMCHSTHEDPETRTRIRVAGIKGLQGVVRKTVNDELQAIIWEPQHMNKLIPSMLFNMQEADDFDSSPSGTERDENPAALAESCFRELLGRAAYGNMNNALRPVLVHLDNHGLWDPNEFAVSCFRIIMYSIQAQHSHHVIQQVLGHLDTHNKDTPRVRAGIVQVLLETVAIAAKGSVGPTVLEVFNTLLKHLRMSVDFEMGADSRRGSASSVSSRSKESEERIVQNAIIQTIGQLAHHTVRALPQIDLGDPTGSTLASSDTPPPHNLPPYLQVTSGFKAKTMAAALPPLFLDPLFSISLMEDSELRQLVLEILHNIIDRHDNRAKLRGIRIIPNVAALKIKREKISKQDVSFMKKHGQQLYRHIYLGCKEEDNVHKNFELLFTALALITIELANEEVVIDLIRLAMALQDMVLANEENMPMFIRCSILALVAAYLNFLSQMIANPPFCQHVICEYNKFLEHLVECTLSAWIIGVSLCILNLKHFYPSSPDEDRLSRRKSFVDTISLQVDLLSSSLPDKVQSPTLKHYSRLEEQEKEKRRQVIEKFQKAPFEEIAAHCESKANMLHDRLAQIFELTIRPPPSPSGTVTITAGHAQYHSVPVYEMKFPDLCVY
uniref:Protein EFR3 homolog A n=1 Tax=Scleropages formosus TaxID=113540 RepID=A0A8C9WFQ7_SCLFO